jgi:hypothetical protein
VTHDDDLHALNRILGSGVPSEAIVFYGRWWQLESWLREVVYVELRSRYGVSWTEELDEISHKRAEGESRNFYMSSADSEELLAYADVSALFRLIEARWELFDALLLPRRRWEGVADGLRELRNRNAHCRRPHRDDIPRLEQTLRDVEAGAWRFYTSYLDTQLVKDSSDPVARSWVAGKHSTARRLLKHAEHQYETRFRLSYSLRPWATPPAVGEISGTPGVLWHAHWTIAGRDLNVRNLWSEIERSRTERDLIVHLLFDLGSVTATFAAADDSAAIADAIGCVFDAILTESRPANPGVDPETWSASWTRGAELLPRCVQVNTPLTLVDPYLPHAFSIFSA